MTKPKGILFIEPTHLTEKQLNYFRKEWEKHYGSIIYKQGEGATEPITKMINTQREINMLSTKLEQHYYDQFEKGEITMEEYLNLLNT